MQTLSHRWSPLVQPSVRGRIFNSTKIPLVIWERLCYVTSLMPIQKKTAFSRRLPDLVTEELVSVLTRKSSFEFKQLFDIVHENLRARNAASGGEEMLRLRAYEKLQNLVARGMVKKTGKKYRGLAALSTLQPTVPGLPVEAIAVAAVA